ncbi:NAD-dependent epimerase/dehydratase family protein [Phytoactinopolyspora mesophila]|uniref:NAD-dependent epimerase/dehydratase family protein n=1 Tax=Phytoactinopolyspora mesophila TaxID=2650750 RepID=UPI001C9E4B38
MTGAVQTVVVTGASGRMGRQLRPKLASPGRLLRLVDLVRADDAGSRAVDEEFVSASITDAAAMADVCAGADAVIHLAGASAESDFGTVTQLNIHGTHNVLEAARLAGVKRVVLASSHHVVGFTHRTDVSERLPAGTPARPDTLYAWSKAALETAGQLYADRFGLDVTCVRIGTFRPVPLTHRDLSWWLSVGDATRLLEACLANQQPGFRIVWGVSRNTRGWGSLDEGAAIGYLPVDDAEDYLDAIVAEHGEPDFVSDPTLNRAGGPWCDIPLGVPLRKTRR